jgi:hypothetical protein
MPYVTTEVEVDLDDFDDDDLIQELISRGYSVAKGADICSDAQNAIWRYKLGYIEEAAFLLERAYPELYGISKYITRS